MTEGARNRNEFGQALRNMVAKIKREGGNRIEGERVEGLGERHGIDPGEARRIFVGLRGDVWQGELVGTDDPAGWSAAELEDVPSTGSQPGSGRP
ncbi:MAG: hypothetical protein M3Q60_11120 [Actinomycetota bacterium]|nr:hypothetical protein [Actinomycetota bacterium]